MKYLKVFDQHSDYQTFVQSADYIRPNISCCKQEHDVHYSPNNLVTCIFKTIGSATSLYLYSGLSQFNANTIKTIYVNDEIVDKSNRAYPCQPNTTYTVKYEFVNNKVVPNYFLGELRESMPEIIIIPDGITEIGQSAFYSAIPINDKTKSITIADSVTTIGDSAFFCCESLTYIRLPRNLSVLNRSLLGYDYELENIEIDYQSVTEIRQNAFNYISINSDKIPIKAEFPNIVTIGNTAFDHCAYFSHLVLGPNLTSMGSGVFNNSTVNSLTLYAETPPTVASSTTLQVLDHIYVPAELVDTYKNASVWSDVNDIIEAIPS